MTCDVCDEPAEFGIVQPEESNEVITLCAYHLARFAIDYLAGRSDEDER